MGYRIDYGGVVPQNTVQTSSRLKIRSFIAAAFLVFCIIVRLFWPEGTQTLQSVFLPHDPSLTEDAFLQLVEDLRQGEKLGDSVNVFCRKIVDEAS